MTTHPRLAGSLVALALVGSSVSTGRSSVEPTALTDEEMRDTVGGVYVNSFQLPPVDNWSQAEDNPQFQLNAMNPYSSAVTVGLFEGTSKYAVGVVSWTNGASGTVQLRSANWPINATKRDVTLKFSAGDSTWYNADGASTRNDAYLNNVLKVGKVRFYNLVETGGGNPTSVGHSLVSLVDHTATFVYDWHTTASVDAIGQQCLQDKRWNYRYETVHTETVPVGCTNFRSGRGCGGTGQPACTSGTGDQCPNWNTVFGNMIDARAAADGFTVNNYVHIIFVNSMSFWSTTTSSYGAADGMAPGNNGKFVFVRDDLNAARMAEVIAHEIGHKQGLCHVNEAGCTQGTNDCTQSATERNLMCTFGGRELAGTQCNVTGPNTQFADWL